MFEYGGNLHPTKQNACKASIVDYFSDNDRRGTSYTMSCLKNSTAYRLMTRERYSEAGKKLGQEMTRDGWKLPVDADDKTIGLALEDAYYVILEWSDCSRLC